MRRVVEEEIPGFPGDGYLEGLQNQGDVVFPLLRVYQKMRVLGHENIGDEPETTLFPRGANGLREPPARAVFGQKRLPTVTGKREIM